jgi:hypothetical protein
MKPCPSCAFLLPAEATTCPYCKSTQVDALTQVDVPQPAFVGGGPATAASGRGSSHAAATAPTAAGPLAWDRRYGSGSGGGNGAWAVHYPSSKPPEP